MHAGDSFQAQNPEMGVQGGRLRACLAPQRVSSPVPETLALPPRSALARRPRGFRSASPPGQRIPSPPPTFLQPPLHSSPKSGLAFLRLLDPSNPRPGVWERRSPNWGWAPAGALRDSLQLHLLQPGLRRLPADVSFCFSLSLKPVLWPAELTF